MVQVTVYDGDRNRPRSGQVVGPHAERRNQAYRLWLNHDDSAGTTAMTDDSLNAVAAEVFGHFDHGEVSDARMPLLKEWVFSVFCWDGALPLAVVVIPHVVSILFGQRQGAKELTFLIVPVAAFVVRYLGGFSRYRAGRMYGWQLAMFFVAIFVLFVLDASLVMASIIGGKIPADYLMFFAALYAAYLAIVSIAMFPGLEISALRYLKNGPQN